MNPERRARRDDEPKRERPFMRTWRRWLALGALVTIGGAWYLGREGSGDHPAAEKLTEQEDPSFGLDPKDFDDMPEDEREEADAAIATLEEAVEDARKRERIQALPRMGGEEEKKEQEKEAEMAYLKDLFTRNATLFDPDSLHELGQHRYVIIGRKDKYGVPVPSLPIMITVDDLEKQAFRVTSRLESYYTPGQYNGRIRYEAIALGGQTIIEEANQYAAILEQSAACNLGDISFKEYIAAEEKFFPGGLDLRIAEAQSELESLQEECAHDLAIGAGEATLGRCSWQQDGLADNISMLEKIKANLGL
ncbi:MAG: hypothetical protein A3G08_01920 [Candidatus Magasanikbacteria bacterium RIFCSPLOWO2_12_FULL_47_9b]|nr:MAG: hypothetical protein A3G08_01920 [Candidatus Magasanikbacteria bacterium RIFCSPLOWO2_12_FULL_47_9b]